MKTPFVNAITIVVFELGEADWTLHRFYRL